MQQTHFRDWLSPLDAGASCSLLRDFGSMLLSEELSNNPRLKPGHPLFETVQRCKNALETSDYVTLAGVGSRLPYGSCSGDDVLPLATLRQIGALYQKNESLNTGIDTEQAAYEKFLAAEQLCSETNAFFRTIRSSGANLEPHFARCLYRAKKKIQMVLGGVPRMDKVPFVFGPGATTTVKQKQATVQSKLAERPTCSENLAHSAWLPAFFREMPHWLQEHQVSEHVDEEGYLVASIELTLEDSRLVFVPKTAFVKRSIITQPTLNSMFQLGIGNYMVKRLKRYAGIDLADQSTNRNLAREGSCTGRLATIDLSSASDTISIELVRLLLPEEWYALLGACRCQNYVYRRKLRLLEHFSAMGNGFTFPLETLIFWALAKSAVEIQTEDCRRAHMLRQRLGLAVDYEEELYAEDRVSVYGDDIIVPNSCYRAVIGVLTKAGFVPNKNKSFDYGAFRESCGGDFFHGMDIRPFYVKGDLSVETLYSLHNFLYRRSRYDHADWVLQRVPPHLRRYGPDGYGDGVLIQERPTEHLFRTRASKRAGWGGYFFKSFKHIGVDTPSIYPGDWISPLYMLYVRGPNPTVPEVIWGDSDFRTGLKLGKDGRVHYPLRGSRGYEEISIYTLNPN